MEKPALLMIHGLIGTLEYFDPTSRLPGIEVRTVDLLGYGSQRGVPPDRLTLQAQVDHVARELTSTGSGPAWILGHSMGGAIAMLLADRHAELIRGLVNVEGNFTLRDAFWSRAIAARSREQWAHEYRGMRNNMRECLTKWGVHPTPRREAWAGHLLDNQPPGTVYAMSKAILKETAEPGFLGSVRCVIDRGPSVHLIAGERSVGDWDVPGFVRKAATSHQVVRGAGHLMMLEEPDEFCRAVKRALSWSTGDR